MFDSRALRLSRRDFLLSAASGAAALAPVGTLSPPPVWSIRQTIKSGTLEVTVLSDGHFLLPTGFLLAPDAPAAERDAVLKAAPPVGDQLQLPNNIAVIRGPSALIVVDAGAGPRHQPTSGKLAGNLEAAGIEPAAVTIVVLTHGHPDHLWGVLDAGNNPVFRNAAYVLSARESEVWSDPNVLRTLPPAVANDRVVGGAKSHLARIKDRIRTVRGGDEIISGVRVAETPGHTPGHISVELSGGDGLVIAGDALTHPIISFQHPTWQVAVDHEPDRGVATRLRLLDRLAADRLRLLGAHLPAPGVGFVERQGGAYRFAPAG